jgi:predicted dehydrogenase
MRAIVVGAGLVATFWMEPLRRRADIAALVEPDEETARAAVERFGLDCPAFGSLDDALAAVRAEIVVNLTPPAHHRAVIETALRAGCHVLTEKPLAPTFDDARACVDAARAAGLTLAVMQNRRHHPAIRRLHSELAGGAIGRPMALQADMSMAPRHSAGHLADAPHPLLLEMAVHTFDQARFLAGADALSASCTEFSAPHSWYAGPAAAICTFELEGGAVFSYRGNWVAEGFATSYDAAWRISGERGTARWDSFGDPECEWAGGRREAWPVPAPRDATGHAACLDELLGALEGGRPSETDGADNLQTLAMVFAAIRSAEERRTVAVDEIWRDQAARSPRD